VRPSAQNSNAALPANNPAITVSAPAKINLTLQVCGKRADGYHLLDSLVVFAGIGDRVSARLADTLKLTVTGPFAGALSAEPDNLVLRAARLLAPGRGADIVLEKNLPVASGIGGGSADAAATLQACGKLWGANPHALGDEVIAAKLGADVPVCLHGRPSFMSGIGEIVQPAPHLPEAWLVLVNPGEPLATKTVFGALGGRFAAAMRREDFANLADAAALAKVLERYTNSLAAPALEALPLIGAVLKALGETPGCLLARLSGSGPTCFGLFADAQAAGTAASRIGAAQPNWWSAAASILRAP